MADFRLNKLIAATAIKAKKAMKVFPILDIKYINYNFIRLFYHFTQLLSYYIKNTSFYRLSD